MVEVGFTLLEVTQMLLSTMKRFSCRGRGSIRSRRSLMGSLGDDGLNFGVLEGRGGE